jgi:alkylhydroperoxidase family enzyme
MLGRSIGITNDQLRHLRDEQPPESLFSEREAVIVRYAQVLAGRRTVDDALYEELTAHLSDQEIVALCLLIGMQTAVTFANRTFLPDIDEQYLQANEAADRAAGGPPIPYPVPPA